MTWTENQFRAFIACLVLTVVLLITVMVAGWADPLLVLPLWVGLAIAWDRL
jgi:hypothetical protein